MGLITTLDVVEDKDAPVVSDFKDAKPNEVTLIWDEDIQLNASEAKITDYCYHTNESNKANKVTIEGNEMKLEFGKDDKLPNGIAYVYVKKENQGHSYQRSDKQWKVRGHYRNVRGTLCWVHGYEKQFNI